MYPVHVDDVQRARLLLSALSGLSARGAVHIAIMRRYEIDRIRSFDAGFDAVRGIERIGS